MFIANHLLSEYVTVPLAKHILLTLYIAKQILVKRCLVIYSIACLLPVKIKYQYSIMDIKLG